MIISWVTVDEPGSNIILYWRSKSKHKFQKKGIVTSYKFFNYTSGYIHHCTIKHLEVCSISSPVHMFTLSSCFADKGFMCIGTYFQFYFLVLAKKIYTRARTHHYEISKSSAVVTSLNAYHVGVG